MNIDEYGEWLKLGAGYPDLSEYGPIDYWELRSVTDPLDGAQCLDPECLDQYGYYSEWTSEYDTEGDAVSGPGEGTFLGMGKKAWTEVGVGALAGALLGKIL